MDYYKDVLRVYITYVSVALQIPFPGLNCDFPGTDIKIHSCLLVLISQVWSYGLLEPISGTSIPTQEKEYLSFGDIQKNYKGFFVCGGVHIIYISSQFT